MHTSRRTMAAASVNSLAGPTWLQRGRFVGPAVWRGAVFNWFLVFHISLGFPFAFFRTEKGGCLCKVTGQAHMAAEGAPWWPRNVEESGFNCFFLVFHIPLDFPSAFCTTENPERCGKPSETKENHFSPHCRTHLAAEGAPGWPCNVKESVF